MNFPTDWGSWGAQDLSERRRRSVKQVPQAEAAVGTVVEERESGWVGAVVGVEAAGGLKVVRLEDRRGRVRSFPLGFGFLIEGESVELTAPTRTKRPSGPQRTASGSFAVREAPARTARASRIWVEGTHDAELVEKVWGDDLRLEGIVVEPLHGADDLSAAVSDFRPGPHRRLGVLLDHLVPGSKESRIAEQAMALPGARGNLLILGHPMWMCGRRSSRTGWGLRPGRRFRAEPTSRSERWPRWGGRIPISETLPTGGSTSSPRCAATPIWSPVCWAGSRS